MLKILSRLRSIPSLHGSQPGKLLQINWKASYRIVQAPSYSDQADPPAKNPKNPFAREAQRKFDAKDNETSPGNPFAGESSFTPEEDGPAAEVVELTPEEREKRLKVLQLEVDIGCQEGRRVPSLDYIQPHNWDHILTLPTKSARYKYYGYLWQIEKKKEAKERKKSEKAEGVELRREEMRREREENNHIIYGLGHTSLFLRIYDSTINHWQNNRLTRAMQFSPKMVLDCSYDQHMTHREAINASKQLMLCFAENRAHDDPFDLHYCNVNLRTPCMKGLQRFIPTMLQPEFPMNVHEKCFTDLFPKENLVYLTPHCRTDLEVYNPDDIYIVGAMVDTVNNEPLSLAKAKRLGLRMARLPLDRYLQWGAGSGKSLTLNQMINIMLDLKKTGDWSQSLKHVPRRKIVNLEQEGERQRNKLEKQANKMNIRIDKLLNLRDYDASDDIKQARQIRSHKKDMEFKLDTWGSTKKKKQSSQ